MHFCSECSNMYYISVNEENTNQLVYYCRHCGHKDTNMSVENVTVSKTQIKRSQQKFSNIINQYTKLDPTLPRINKIKCPNTVCKTNVAEDPTDREIIYIRYDDVNMKYVYLCTTCETVWKSGE